ncbi:hypothetical protein V8B97DRAFT_1122862 [Scleroderma yunnanense]
MSLHTPSYRSCILQSTIRVPFIVRHASTFCGPYPFPTHRHPTPHEIFHLPRNASQEKIKARYYELVRLYHPDSPHVRSLPHAERTSRFQAFQRAYDILKRPGQADPAAFDDLVYAEIARRRRLRSYRRSPGGMETRGFNEDTHTQSPHVSDAMAHDVGAILRGIGITTLCIGMLMVPIMAPGKAQQRSAAANLAQAHRDAQEFGMERRRHIRQSVQEYEAEQGKPLKKRTITRRQRDHDEGQYCR